MRKICVVTGTRAEYGLLSGVMKLIDQSPLTELQILVTNMHLSEIHGNTYQEIEQDGFIITKKIPILGPDDSAYATVEAMAKAQLGFADAFAQLQPDMLLVLGDRFEILSAVSAALIYKIPVAHIHGGEITEGAYDNAIRHAISKMSHLHFVAAEEYKQRLLQMGEQPHTVFTVGALGVENCKKVPRLSRIELEKSIGFELNKQTVLVTYHPETLLDISVEQQIQQVLEALRSFPDISILFTLPNSDTGGRIVVDAIETFVSTCSHRTKVIASLGMHRYLSVLQYIGAVVGNSSSGVIEVPSFGIPTLNIGNRQKGRIMPQSIVQCDIDTESIIHGLHTVLSKEQQEIAASTVNPLEQKQTALQIFSQISSCSLENCIQKIFYTYQI